MEALNDLAASLVRSLIPVSLFLWGMVRCRSLAVEPDTNPHAPRGLMFALGGWVVLLLYGPFAPYLPSWMSLAVFAVVLLLCGYGAALAFKGVSAWSRYSKGNVHGVLALIIALGLSALVLYALVRGLTRAAL